jgi:AcrR family transcriptional regulator
VSPRAGLDRAAVAAAAAALADEEGLERLTLARVAERLGIRTPSLYNHVAGLAGLRREMAVFGVRELGRRLSRAAIGKTGDEAIEALADAHRAFVGERPGLYAATLPASRLREPADPELQAAEQEALEPVLVVLASSYGLEDEEALHATRCLRATVHGFATLEVAGGFGLALDTDESFRRLVRTIIGGLRRGELAGVS